MVGYLRGAKKVTLIHAVFFVGAFALPYLGANACASTYIPAPGFHFVMVSSKKKPVIDVSMV